MGGGGKGSSAPAPVYTPPPAAPAPESESMVDINDQGNLTEAQYDVKEAQKAKAQKALQIPLGNSDGIW